MGSGGRRRTRGGLPATWAELNRVFEVALANAKHRGGKKPGGWNDPDYLQVGWIGSGDSLGDPSPARCRDEQYSFVSLWCLMALPLFYSGDMSKLDAFTVNLLCNPEVIEVDQDSLGQFARVTPLDAKTFLMVKDLDDGSKAVGLCNGGTAPKRMALNWADAGLAGPQIARDLWRQKDLGTFRDQFTADVPPRAWSWSASARRRGRRRKPPGCLLTFPRAAVGPRKPQACCRAFPRSPSPTGRSPWACPRPLSLLSHP